MGRLGWLAAALVLLAGSVCAQEEGRPAAPAGITVQGRGEVRIQPDIARLTLGVQTVAADSARAAADNAERTQRVISAVRGAGVAEKDIQTENYAIYPRYQTKDRPLEGGGGMVSEPVIVGYQVDNTVRVTVRKLADVSRVIDAAIKAGANVASGLAFDVEDPNPGKDAALREAVADALRKARVVADAIKASSIVLVAVVEGPVSIPRPFAEMAMMRSVGADAAQTPIQPGEQTVTALVTARFNFIPALAPQR